MIRSAYISNYVTSPSPNAQRRLSVRTERRGVRIELGLGGRAAALAADGRNVKISLDSEARWRWRWREVLLRESQSAGAKFLQLL